MLSEGEQKIIALAAFLTECTINNSRNSIVFDDPVNSLDHKYKDKIAEMLAKLSTNRQMIIFTHDLYFVRLLQEYYEKILQKKPKVIELYKEGEFAGIQYNEIPFFAQNIEERITKPLLLVVERLDQLTKDVYGNNKNK